MLTSYFITETEKEINWNIGIQKTIYPFYFKGNISEFPIRLENVYMWLNFQR